MTATTLMRGAALASGVLLVLAALAGCSTDTGPSTPAPLLTQRLAIGDGFSCALDHTGMPSCWGAGSQGQLGNNAATASATPVRVSGGPYKKLTASGATVCGLRSDGTVDCWGVAPPGCCGQKSLDVFAPVRVVTSVRFSDLVVGFNAACGIDEGSTAYCFGNELDGSFGDGQRVTELSVPMTPVAGNHKFASVSLGGVNGCGIDTEGSAWCWGDNIVGELGTGESSEVPDSVPVPVSGGLRFTSLSAGAFYACGVTTGGIAVCWGNNIAGQLGDAMETNSNIPVPVLRGPFVQLFTAQKHLNFADTCGLDSNGSASCWGLNDYNQLGNTLPGFCFGLSCDPTPTAVPGRLSFLTLSLGVRHTCGMVSDGHVYCWGDNQDGELGDGTMTSSITPVLSLFIP